MKTLLKSSLAGLAVIIFSAAMATAQTVIISDNFPGQPNSSVSLNGTSPSGTNAPNTTYVNVGSATPLTWATTWGFPPGAFINSQGGGLGLSLNGLGGNYTSGGGYTLTARIEAPGAQSGASAAEALFGFYDVVSGGGYQNFWGLSLTEAGIATVTGTGAGGNLVFGTRVSAVNGVFSAFQTLSFTVNSNGSLGAVTLNGNSVTGFDSISFTGHTNYLGMAAGASQNNRSYFDDISVSYTAVPEPGSVALLAVAGLGLVFVRSRRKA